MKVAIFAMTINVIFNFILIGPLAHAGLALASSISSICNVLILLWALLIEKIYLPLAGWRQFCFQLLFANTLMGALLWWFTPELSLWIDGGITMRVSTLFTLIMGAIIVYFASLWLTGLRFTHLKLQKML